MMASGSMASLITVNVPTQMGRSMKENGKMESLMGKVLRHGVMGDSMMVFGETENHMEPEKRFILTVNQRKAIGKRASLERAVSYFYLNCILEPPDGYFENLANERD